MAQNAVQIENNAYLRSHGRAPKGYGSWGFLVMDDSTSPATEARVIFTPCAMNFASASKWAINEVRTEMADELATGNLYLEVAP